MKKQTIKAVLILLAMIVAAVTAYPFFKKTYLDYELVHAFPQGSSPTDSNYDYDYEQGLHYVVYHDWQSMKSSNFIKSYLTTLDPLTSSTSSNAPDEMQNRDKEAFLNSFNFDRYSYVVFRAKKVTSMYYSDKTTYFDDRSSPIFSCRKRGKKCVFVTYDPNSVHGIYIYRVKKDVLLRGFYFNG